ncbi:DUF2187 family protein [Bacillus sp. SM2101]|uniref:DUF2187 family protein n=1 Tax=Bacillus sp. SM2101 TaxID=2805366 RepID=UPI001BDF0A49|nr:DUF2187 family protein [Bacillus sp. SM2101]
MKKNKAKVGEVVSFERQNTKIEGKIIKILERSAIVELSDEAADKIESPSNLTVVNHNNYSILVHC